MDGIGNRGWNRRSKLVHGRERIFAPVPQVCQTDKRILWNVPRQQCIYGCPKSIDIGAWVRSRAIVLRGCEAGRTMAQLGCGILGIILLGNAKIHQHRRMVGCSQDDVGRFDVTVQHRWVLPVQVGHCLDDRCHYIEYFRQSEAPVGPLSPNLFQVQALDILHEQINPLALLIDEQPEDPRQGRVLQALKQFAFAGQPIPGVLRRLYHLFEGKQRAVGLPIAHQVDRSKATRAQDLLYQVAIPYHGSPEEQHFSCQHGSSPLSMPLRFSRGKTIPVYMHVSPLAQSPNPVTPGAYHVPTIRLNTFEDLYTAYHVTPGAYHVPIIRSEERELARQEHPPLLLINTPSPSTIDTSPGQSD